MTLSRFLSDMLTADEYSTIHAMTSLAELEPAQKRVLEHYRDWFIVLRDAGFMAELDFVEERPTRWPRPQRDTDRGIGTSRN